MLEIVCRLLLLVHPPRFRRDFGGEIARLVRDRARAARSEPWPARARNAAEAILDLATSALGEWRAAWRERRAAAGPRVQGAGGRGAPLRDLLVDVRYALRVLAARPAFTLAALVTLAVGIGATTAIYSLADAVLLHPLPVRDPDRLVSWPWASSYPDFEAYRAGDQLITDVFAESGLDAVSLSSEGRADLVSAALVSGGYFDALGVESAAGRLAGPGDDAPGAALTAVLSHGFWQRRFAGDPEVVGSAVTLNGRPATIVGVAARGFRGTSLRAAPDVWVPLRPGTVLFSGFLTNFDLLNEGRVSWLNVTGRLVPGVTAEAASSAIDAVYRQRHPPRPGDEPERLVLGPLVAVAVGTETAGDLSRFITLLTGMVAFALLVACANVANMLLVRATERRREAGLRLALGATRSRLVRQFLTETLMLGAGGGLAGLALAAAVLRLLASFHLPGRIAIADLNLSLDAGALGVASVLAVGTSVAFGLLPAWTSAASRPVDALRGQWRVTGRNRLRAALVAAQVALCLVLLAGAGLFARALGRALAIDPGFDVEAVAAAAVDPSLEHLSAAEAMHAYDRILARVVAMPAVQSAAWATVMPLRGTVMGDFSVEGYQPTDGEEMSVRQNYVWPGYFDTLGIPIRRGRQFTADDRAGSQRVVIVSERFARRYFAGRDPIGRTVTIGWGEPVEALVVGVAADSRWSRLDGPQEPFVYLPLRQFFADLGTSAAYLLVRAPGRAADVAGRLGAEIRGVDGRLAPFRIATLADLLSELVTPQRMGLTLLGFFGATTLLLAAVGIYGVASYAVTQRRREIGIRLALGAEPGHVRALVLRQSLGPIAIGLGLGLVATALASPLAARFLYGLSPFDPITLALVGLVLAALATLAGDLPARRAMRVDPAEPLRTE